MKTRSEFAKRFRQGLWLMVSALASGLISSLGAQDSQTAKKPQTSTSEPTSGPTSPNQTSVKPPPTDTPGIMIITPTKGVDFSRYLAEVLKIVKLQWHAEMPPEAWAGQKGVTSIVFKIGRDGSVDVTSVEMERSAGNDALDKAAKDAVNSAGPFEPLPEGFHGNYIELRFVFFYNLKADVEGKAPEIKAPAEKTPPPTAIDAKPATPQR